jgi:hypothetical protein
MMLSLPVVEMGHRAEKHELKIVMREQLRLPGRTHQCDKEAPGGNVQYRQFQRP